MQERLAHPEDFTLPPTDETANAVSILTVHKSKGLEFPVVILADLSRKETNHADHAAQHLFSWQYNIALDSYIYGFLLIKHLFII